MWPTCSPSSTPATGSSSSSSPTSPVWSRPGRPPRTHWRPRKRRWRARRSVGEVAAVVLEDQADDGEYQEHRADQEQPPADREADRRRRGGEGHVQRPPAVRAEEPELPGALLDLALIVILGTLRQPAAGEQDVEAGQHGQANGERERGGAGRLLRDVPVHDVRAGEEDAAAEKQPALNFHMR